ncbi:MULTISPECIES: MaoC/PaaZ C-terminal domain-containing protein [Sphingobium]|uniref:MaoC/PaaZ C-terminal domain-containing protein n=1 Tax=Sphingobium sp. MI1205 TaxID=407020 RepID=UPI00076FE52B|nr:MaoC/PaaZ C-terminal domain-containing protein [Sphingobium sp. MI1205]AMK19884.1 MaoC-like dehydratase [Sphingobium sp. MI1205]
MKIAQIEQLALDPVEQSYDHRDVILYALGIGYGADPLAEDELPFVYERNLQCLPSFANLLCEAPFWQKDPAFGIDWQGILHAEQRFELHRPLPSRGKLRGFSSIIGIEDKGAGRGALLHQQRNLVDAASGDLLATLRATLFLRNNGGQGGFGQSISPPAPIEGPANGRVLEYATLPGQALMYRLNGDWNPLHADPAVARRAGFGRPILHGLCTQGIACRAILSAYCGGDPARLKSMFVRFSRPVMPGETIRIEFHEENSKLLRFRAIAKERDLVVLDRCSAELH